MIEHVYEVYAAYVNSDLTEGRGRDELVGYFTRKADAEAAVKGKDVMGSDGKVKKFQARLVIFENLKEHLRYEKSLARQRALQKLTADELILLGLKPAEVDGRGS